MRLCVANIYELADEEHRSLVAHPLSIYDIDDCNWADHVGDINREFGVVGVRTPQGLTLKEFYEGLEMFRLQKRK